MKAGVIGYPIHHSKSPIIHRHWIEEYKIEGTYDAIEIKPEDLEIKIQELIEQGFNGFNITAPHKENIFKLCEEVDDNAKKIGAVNTVIIRDKKLYGKNTDAFGFVENLKSSQHIDLKGKNALVLGAGGAARAVIYGLLSAGIEKIYLTNRTIEKANILKEFDTKKIIVVDWQQKENYLHDINLLVNTTSLGMNGKPALEINLNNLNQDAIVTDIVYAPLMTDLLKQAKDRGNNIVTGVGMLLHQARPAFEAWTGILPNVSNTLEKKILA